MQIEGLHFLLKTELQDWQLLGLLAVTFSADDRVFRNTSLSELISYFLKVAKSVNLFNKQLYVNHNAAFEESCMIALPWTWIVL